MAQNASGPQEQAPQLHQGSQHRPALSVGMSSRLRSDRPGTLRARARAEGALVPHSRTLSAQLIPLEGHLEAVEAGTEKCCKVTRSLAVPFQVRPSRSTGWAGSTDRK